MIIHPTYFAPVIQYIAIAGAEKVHFEANDHYQKQTYRNRCYIYGANGKLLLSVPVIHKGKHGRQMTREVRIDNGVSWQKNHFRSIQTAYRSSPFFEYYEDEIAALFDRKSTFLYDMNLEINRVICDLLQLETSFGETENYNENYSEIKDFRTLVNAKSPTGFVLNPYHQVFEAKHGFLPDLSILDLLFNEGTSALMYLEAQQKLLF